MSNLWETYLRKSLDHGNLLSLSLEITDFCNFNCVHCYKIRESNYMSTDLFERILDEACSLNVTSLSFNGGEPLKHKEINSFIEKALRRGLFVTVLSNGSEIKSIIDRDLLKSQALRWQISLYGSDESSCQEIIRRKGMWNRVIESLELLKETGALASVTLSLLNVSGHDPRIALELIKKMGFRWQLTEIISVRENGDVFPHGYRPSDETIAEFYKYAPIESNLVEECNLPGYACGAGVTTLAIKTNGDVLPCLTVNYFLGNIFENSVKTVLESGKLAEFREMNRIPHDCRQCDFFDFCPRCPGIALMETGRINGVVKENCRIAAIKSKNLVYSEKK
ncbi:radical SAM protein [Myxococcota bacterium]|nr:radical SAM protein [Myxococcota bacterium]MBU1382494.1 radical SAM protein [Myxococcota bacterium]MBU1497944.1 radical SAM protein [Myxococcota bacterium]